MTREPVVLGTMRKRARRPARQQTSSTGEELLARWWGAAIALGALLCLVVTGMIGLNFGHHWDEPTQLSLVNATVTSGSFLPHWYRYPSVSYLLSLLAVLPRVITRLHSQRLITGSQFYLHARTIFLFASSLGGLGLYLGLRRRGGELGAAFGAATYLLSYQLAYHSRWIAPDAVLASVTGLFLWSFTSAWDAPGTGWRSALPAVVAGLATATKYQGAVLMVPVAVMWLHRWRTQRDGLVIDLRRILRDTAGFLLAFVVLTPGAILQHRTFISDVRSENSHYHTGHAVFDGVSPYDVHSHVRYFWSLTQYVLISLPSRYPAISAMVIALALVGLVTLARREPLLAVAVAAPAVIVEVYYSTLVVFIVRNFLMVLPFVAFFAAIGVARLVEFARTKLAVSFLATVLLVLMALNGAWLAHAAATITDRSTTTLMRESDSYMRARSDRVFVLSGAVRRDFRRAGLTLPKNARERGNGDYLVVLLSQFQRPGITLRQLPATSRGTFRDVGPLEVDLDFYPTWQGADYVLFITPNEAARFGMVRSQFALGS